MQSSPPNMLGFLLNDATRAIRRRFEQRAAELGISASQWRLLVLLKRQGPVPQARIAKLLEIEPISVSRLVDRMQDAGWVSRETDPKDRRLRIVGPTEKTRAAFEDAQEISETIYEDALRGLPAETTAGLAATLRKIIDNLSDSTETKNDK